MISVPWTEEIDRSLIGRPENFPLEPGSHFPSMTSNPTIQHHEGDLTELYDINPAFDSNIPCFCWEWNLFSFLVRRKHMFFVAFLLGGVWEGGAGSHFIRK